MLTNITLQPILSKILFGSDEQQFLDLVVPKQGNLLNPQQAVQCSAYFMYYIKAHKKELLNTTEQGVHVAHIVSDIVLQCVGKQSEEFMLATMFWDERSDVRKSLEEQNCTLLETPRAIYSVPYFQDGANTILSHEVTFRLSQTLVYTEPKELWQGLELKGSLKIIP